MSDLCYKCSGNDVCLNSFHCAFVHKEVRCTNKIEIKDGFRYTNKKLPGDINHTRPGDIIINTPEDLLMNCLLEALSL